MALNPDKYLDVHLVALLEIWKDDESDECEVVLKVDLWVRVLEKEMAALMDDP